MKKLKIIRLTLGIIITFIITAFFLDINLSLPETLHRLLHVQFIPALMGMTGILIILLLLTFLFGRIYCSVICPLGVFQDFISWLSKRINKKKKFKYTKPLNVLRYIFLGIMALSFICGFTLFVGLLDPYSNYGRIATHLFKPIVLFINNLLAMWSEYNEDYYFVHIPIEILSIFSFITSIISLFIVVILSFRAGRTFCNTICPVGTLLGLISKISIFRIRIDADKCKNCGLCEMKCKSQCINSKEKSVDVSRCVDCYNCLSKCKRGALSYTRNKKNVKVVGNDAPIIERRQLLFGASAILLTGALPKILKGQTSNNKNTKELSERQPIIPPGANSIDHFNQTCTSCHICINRCPQKVLKPANMEYGLKGIMQPTLDYTNGFCEYECEICSQVCPNRAIDGFKNKDDKKQTQIGIATYNSKYCQVNTMGLSCGICAENCPAKAITMIPNGKNLLIPSVNRNKCIGCGACEYYCPTEIKNKAIWINGLKVHNKI